MQTSRHFFEKKEINRRAVSAYLKPFYNEMEKNRFSLTYLKLYTFLRSIAARCKHSDGFPYLKNSEKARFWRK